MRNKIQTSITLSVEAIRLIVELTKKLGLSKTAVLELAVRRLAEIENIQNGDSVNGKTS